MLHWLHRTNPSFPRKSPWPNTPIRRGSVPATRDPRCSLRVGGGPALQVQSANARLLVDRHFLGGLNLIQMLLPHNELPVMVGGAGGITPLDIPPIPPLYSRRGVLLATRKIPLLPLVFRRRRRPLRRGLPYRGASIRRRDPPGRSPLSPRRGSGPFTSSLRPRNEGRDPRGRSPLGFRSLPRTVSPQAKP